MAWHWDDNLELTLEPVAVPASSISLDSLKTSLVLHGCISTHLYWHAREAADAVEFRWDGIWMSSRSWVITTLPC